MPRRKSRILTRLNGLREANPLRFWIATGFAGFSAFGMVAAFGIAPTNGEMRVQQKTVVEQLAVSTALADASNSTSYFREERIQRGDTVASLISRLGVQDEAAIAYLRQSPDTQTIFRQLRPGKVVTTKTDENGGLLSLSFPLGAGKDSVLLVEKHEGKLRALEQPIVLDTELFMKSGEIKSSLFAATDDAGLPDSVAVQLAEIFGGDIDFHRDLRRGDHFSVVYEMLYHEGRPIRPGRILAAEFSNQGKRFQAIWFQQKDGAGSYYAADGKSLRKAFLRSPLEFSRITSGFTSSRFHPILQTWRAHKGVDYGAPAGTRVKATGDGVVEFAGRQGGYGNLLVIRHQGKYTTHYGHLAGFAPGIRKGTRITQGEVVGYVGATGWATGPHLHYEFRINDVQQNPLSAALPTAIPLGVAQLSDFRRQAESLVARLEQMRGLSVASLD